MTKKTVGNVRINALLLRPYENTSCYGGGKKNNKKKPHKKLTNLFENRNKGKY